MQILVVARSRRPSTAANRFDAESTVRIKQTLTIKFPMKTIALLAALTLFFTASKSEAITYTVLNDSIDQLSGGTGGPFTLTGTITTDGSTGLLNSTSFITAWNFTMTGATTSYQLSSSDAGAVINYNPGFILTPTAFELDGSIRFSNAASTYISWNSIHTLEAYNSANLGNVNNGGWTSNGIAQPRVSSGIWLIAVPEPSTYVLLVGSVLALVGAMRRGGARSGQRADASGNVTPS